MGTPVLRLTNHNLFRHLGDQLIRRRMPPLTSMSVVTTTMPGVIQELMTGELWNLRQKHGNNELP